MRGEAKGRMVWFAIALAALAAACAYMTSMPGRSHQGPLAPLTPGETEVRDRLAAHVRALAGDIGERHLGRPEALEAAIRYVETQLEDLGYEAASERFTVSGRSVRNLAVRIPGQTNEIILAGAHYDTMPGTPGADDNASGVAALLELARLLRGARPGRTIRLVAFVNEEAPYFETGGMGSRVHARAARGRGERIVAMLSLESIGYYSDARGSQNYPVPFGLFYPSTANFIGFVANLGSRSLVRRAIASFRSHTPFPSEGVAAPELVPGVDWSDHGSFWREGFPAIMVTDTAPYRNPTYHAPSDEPATLDYERTARVVAGIARVIVDLAG